MYEKLAQICRGKRVVLVTATPLNNAPRDILSQIKLFQNGKNSAIPSPTTKKLMAALQNEINPLKILGVLRRDIPAYFFQPTQAARSNRNNAPREVILSA